MVAKTAVKGLDVDVLPALSEERVERRAAPNRSGLARERSTGAGERQPQETRGGEEHSPVNAVRCQKGERRGTEGILEHNALQQRRAKPASEEGMAARSRPAAPTARRRPVRRLQP